MYDCQRLSSDLSRTCMPRVAFKTSEGQGCAWSRKSGSNGYIGVMWICRWKDEKKKHSLGSFKYQLPCTCKGVACQTDGTSDPSSQVPCLQQWSVLGVCEAFSLNSTWPTSRWGTKKTNLSQGPELLILCPIDIHKDKCSGQIFAWCSSPLRLKCQKSPLGYI